MVSVHCIWQAKLAKEFVDQQADHRCGLHIPHRVGLLPFGEVVSYHQDVLVSASVLGSGPRMSIATPSIGLDAISQGSFSHPSELQLKSRASLQGSLGPTALEQLAIVWG